jgi:hypothetical protein
MVIINLKNRIMAILTNQFLREQKVNNNFQMVVMYCGSEHVIANVTAKNIMLKQCSKENRGNCGRFNSGRCRMRNNERSTEWYFENRIIK